MSSDVARRAFDAGFRHFGPVSPPGAPGINPKDAGKAPAEKNEKTGNWYNIAVQQFRCRDAATADLWDRWGANFGFACGRAWNLYGNDLDIEDDALLDIAIESFSKRLGPDMLIRGVADPKHRRCLIPFKVIGPLTKGTNLTFAHPQGVKVQIDGLWEGKQFVAHGIHPGTMTPYTWAPGNPFDYGPSIFPSMTVQEFQECLDEIEAAFEARGVKRTSGKPSVLGPAIRGSAHYPVIGTRHEVEGLMALMPKANDPRFSAYADWLPWCFHIMAASNRQDWGRDLWLEWCSHAPQEPGVPEAKWDDTKLGEVRSNGVTTIRKWLKQHSPGALAILDFENAPLDIEEIDEAAEPSKLWPRLRRRWVFDLQSEHFVDTLTGKDYGKTAIDVRYGRLFGSLRAECGHTDPKKGPKTVSGVMLGQDDMQMVFGLTYWPGESQIAEIVLGAPLLNLWKPGPRPAHPNVVDTDIQTYLDHCTMVLRDPTHVVFWLKWCAYIVQYPNRKPNWHWLIMTLPGLGKDFMLRPLAYAVGRQNHQPITADVLASSFNPFLKAKLITISEIRQVSRANKSASDVFNDLKTYMARPPEEVPINEKGLKPYMAPNLSAWVMLSNHRAPLVLERDDRRIFVSENFDTKPKDVTHYAYVDKWLTDNENLVASFFAQYPLTDKDINLIEGHAPITSAKNALAYISRDTLETLVASYIEDAKIGINPMVTTPGSVLIGIKDHLPPRFATGTKQVAVALHACGARPVKPDPATGGRTALTVRISGKKDPIRLWRLADIDEKGNRYDLMDENQLKNVHMTGSVSPDSTDTGAKVVQMRKPTSAARTEEDEDLP